MKISEAFINALLADATYALGSKTEDGMTGTKLEDCNEGKLKERMTPALAKYIGDNFTVVTHIETDDIIGSGFDATVWKDNNSGKLYVSMQGTVGMADFLAARPTCFPECVPALGLNLSPRRRQISST